MALPIAAIAAGASGLMKVAGGIFGSRRRKRAEKRAQAKYNRYENEYRDIDFSNLYANQSNTYEDLTVNQQQANFLAEQSQQSLANTLAQTNQAAGGAGIASVAQAIMQIQNENLAKAGISIGQQERENMLLQAQAEDQMQQREIEGGYLQREQELERTTTLMGMAGQELAAAKQARQEARQSVLSGVGDIAGGALTFGAADGWFGDTMQGLTQAN